MVFEEAKIGAKGARAFIAWAYYLLALKLRFNEDDGVLSGKGRLEALRERHHLNRGGLKGLCPQQILSFKFLQSP